MSPRRSTRENHCPHCSVFKTLCFCSLLVQRPCLTRVVFLLHHREKHLPSNTARWAHGLLESSELKWRGLPGEKSDLAMIQTNDYTPMLLFPDPDAKIIDEEFVLPLKPIMLVVPDGTWRQARKFRKREKELSELPCVKIAPKRPSEYLLRKQHRDDGLSTFEATAWALKFLEGPIQGPLLFEHMEQVFKQINQRFMLARQGIHQC